MKSKRLIVTTIILLGSLWGLSELGIDRLNLPDGVLRAPLLTAAAILFLVAARMVWNAPGSSLTLAVLASAFKFLNHPFFGCKIAAVLILGAVFDLAFSAATARRTSDGPDRLRAAAGTYVRAAAATLISFVAFGFFARFVLANPFWIAGGTGKMIEYQLLQGVAATALAVPATFAALRVSAWMLSASETWSRARWTAYRLTAAGAGIAGVATALAAKL